MDIEPPDPRRLVGAEDVDGVLRWAAEVAATEETSAVYVESTDAGGPGVLRLTGTDPTALPPVDGV